MHTSPIIKAILKNYESDHPGTKTNLVRLLTHGRLGNTGKLVILPVDQGFEHGPILSFAMNEAAYDPHYHFELAIEAGLSAYAAPLGMLEAGADTFAGQIPTILKMNSANTLSRLGNEPLHANQAITSSVQDALRLGAIGIGLTIYPGADSTYDMFEDVQAIAEEAKAHGLIVVIWAYPRGNMSKQGESSIDVVSYSAHMACLLGAHIVKVKLPSDHVECDKSASLICEHKIDISTQAARVRHIVKSSFNGRRLVVFSGGESKTTDDILADTQAIKQGGGTGSIIGRNCFQRTRKEALALLDQIIKIYQ